MKVLNIGIPEALFIVVLIFIVLGPDKMISSAKSLGIWLRKTTKSSLWRDFISTRDSIRNLPNTLMHEADLEDEMEFLDQIKLDKSENSDSIENNAIFKE